MTTGTTSAKPGSWTFETLRVHIDRGVVFVEINAGRRQADPAADAAGPALHLVVDGGEVGQDSLGVIAERCPAGVICTRCLSRSNNVRPSCRSSLRMPPRRPGSSRRSGRCSRSPRSRSSARRLRRRHVRTCSRLVRASRHRGAAALLRAESETEGPAAPRGCGGHLPAQPAAATSANRSRFQPPGEPTASRIPSHPWPWRSRLRCSSSTWVASGPSAVNRTSTSLVFS